MMANALVECIPNFSEGKDVEVIEHITAAIRSIAGITLLSTEMGADANRTVVTFIGPPEAVQEAAFQGIRTAAALIDMQMQQGIHPRIGATDVCPFVPVKNMTMAEVVSLSRNVAQRVGEMLDIPVYLYEASATVPERRLLANIRAGAYEGLPKKLQDPNWQPDFGPSRFNARSGATVIGAREFLIAYNINLNTTDTCYANDIALELREKGRSARSGDTVPLYANGTVLKYAPKAYPSGIDDFIGKTFEETRAYCRDQHDFDPAELLKLHGFTGSDPVGFSVKKPGRFKHLRALGWYVEQYQCAQVSFNLTNYRLTPLHQVMEATRQLAARRGLAVTGSEIIGLVPFEAIAEAGQFYHLQQHPSSDTPAETWIQTAIQALGLNDTAPFNPKEKILGLPENWTPDAGGIREK